MFAGRLHGYAQCTRTGPPFPAGARATPPRHVQLSVSVVGQSVSHLTHTVCVKWMCVCVCVCVCGCRELTNPRMEKTIQGFRMPRASGDPQGAHPSQASIGPRLSKNLIISPRGFLPKKKKPLVPPGRLFPGKKSPLPRTWMDQRMDGWIGWMMDGMEVTLALGPAPSSALSFRSTGLP